MALAGAIPNTLFHLIPARRHSQTVVSNLNLMPLFKNYLHSNWRIDSLLIVIIALGFVFPDLGYWRILSILIFIVLLFKLLLAIRRIKLQLLEIHRKELLIPKESDRVHFYGLGLKIIEGIDYLDIYSGSQRVKSIDKLNEQFKSIVCFHTTWTSYNNKAWFDNHFYQVLVETETRITEVYRTWSMKPESTEQIEEFSENLAARLKIGYKRLLTTKAIPHAGLQWMGDCLCKNMFALAVFLDIVL
jgi:hypothetical protein